MADLELELELDLCIASFEQLPEHKQVTLTSCLWYVNTNVLSITHKTGKDV